MRFAQLAIVVGLFSINSVQAEDEKTTGDAKPQVKNVVTDEPMSIFGPEVRKFKFRINDTLVTNEVAQAFTVTYDVPDNPKIFGAYPDTEANALVVIAPPEAELAIRRSLATRFAEIMGYGNPSMEVKKRKLLNERNVNLHSILGVELALVEAETGNSEKDVQQLKDHLKLLEAELAVTEKKIQVVNKYLKRLNEFPE